MKISKSHYALFHYQKDDEVISNPQKYLGPNCEEVLRFWNHLDEMSVGQLIEVGEKSSKIDSLIWGKFTCNIFTSCNILNIDYNSLDPVIIFFNDIPENLKPYVAIAASTATGEIAANIENPVVLPLFNFG